MRLALGVRDKAGLGLEPLCALNTVVLSKAREIFCCLGLFVPLEVPWACEVSFDLIDIPASWLVDVETTVQSGLLTEASVGSWSLCVLR